MLLSTLLSINDIISNDNEKRSDVIDFFIKLSIGVEDVECSIELHKLFLDLFKSGKYLTENDKKYIVISLFEKYGNVSPNIFRMHRKYKLEEILKK